jgi:hypothetical protein
VPICNKGNISRAGFIKTNFGQATVITKKSQDPNSAYSQMMQKVAVNSSSMAEINLMLSSWQNILQAVTSKNPTLKHLAGKDVEIWAVDKKTMSDTEFHNMIKNMAW